MSCFARFCFVFWDTCITYSKNIGFPRNILLWTWNKRTFCFPEQWNQWSITLATTVYVVVQVIQVLYLQKNHAHLYSYISTDRKALGIYFLLWDGFWTLFFPLIKFLLFLLKPKHKNSPYCYAARINCLSSHQNPPLINKTLEISKGL